MITECRPLISVVVPLYNNRAIVPECFPSVAALRGPGSAVGEIVAVDDGSSDGTAAWLRERYPEVTLLVNGRNMGFGRTCRRGIEQASCPWVVLLNSDVRVVSDIITPLVEHIRTLSDLFAVSFYSFNEKNEKFEGRKKIVPKTGLFKVRNEFSGDYADGVRYDTFYACGGHMLVSREKFLALGGFSEVFEPFYWEDVDLSYRAGKRGWKVFFDPRCRVVHAHGASIRTRHHARDVEMVQTRNRMLFFWKNVSSPTLWLRHTAGMAVRILFSWISGDFIFYRAFGEALVRLPQAMRERSVEKKEWRQRDRDLFRIGHTEPPRGNHGAT
jgi:GT2 family glycosyltransferase